MPIQLNYYLRYVLCCIVFISMIFPPDSIGQGELCSNAATVSVGSHIANGPSSGNGASGVDCGSANGGSPAHADWYQFTPAQDGIYTITSTNSPALIDTRLKIWTGSCGDLICVDGDDDDGDGFSSLVSTCLSQGVTYFIEWDNRWSSSGFQWDIILDFDISCAPQNNDNCSGATLINPGCSIVSNNLYATDSNPPICGSANDSISGGVWYKVIRNGVNITASTCNPGTNFDTQMLLYSGTCGNLVCLEGNDDQGNPLDASCDVLNIFENRASTIEWSSSAGVEYFLYVAGFGTKTGFFELSIESSITGNCSGPSVLYVDSSATGTQSGISWENAFDDLKDAIVFANQNGPIDSILVAKGTYRPDASAGRNAHFSFPNDIVLMGGFPSGGGPIASRNPEINQSILSGKLLDTDLPPAYVYHVVVIEASDLNIVLDGFHILNGNANGGGTDDKGAALLVFGKIEGNNLTLNDHFGSGPGSLIFCSGANAQLKLSTYRILFDTGLSPPLISNSSDSQILMLGSNEIMRNE